jgi:hypothetical protein
MNVSNLFTKLTNDDIIENNNLLNEMCNKKIDNDLCDETLIKTKESKINGDLYSDLEVFEDFKGNENTLLEKINNTYTDGGKYYLKKLLENPSDNFNFLNNKKNSFQNIFQVLEKNKNDIQEFFIKLNETEKSLFWIFNTNNEEHDNLVNILYFNNFLLKYLNNSSYVLTGYNIYNIFCSPLIGVLSPIVGFILPYLVLRFKLKVKFSFVAYIKFLYNYYMKMNFGNMFGNSYLNNIRKVWYAFTMLFYFNGIFNSFQLSKLSNNINLTICEHISKCAIFIKNGINLLNKIYIKNDYNTIFNIEYDYNINNFIINDLDNLNITTNEYFNNFGQKLRLYKLLKNPSNKVELNNLINLIYLSDTINSLYLTKIENNLVMPDYSNSAEPIVSIIGLRHPNIEKEKVIKNDIYLDNKNNLVITGPNAGGKSTFIKAIGINILLSQTLCLTFCDNIKITPFYYIASQMTIIDHKGVESLFEAEMNRIIKNVNIIKECNKTNRKSIIFLDELFNSTNIIEGICGSYGICKNLADINTNITLLTTHFTYLYKLKDTGGYNNYKMNVKINKDIIEFPYKISKGISTQYIALELLKKKLVDCQEIIETSLEFKNELIEKFK